jgi:hypothetical protein
MKNHGKSRTKAYSIWYGMIYRCSNPNHASWEYYGGRGIKVCERWLSLENFITDMGEPPEGLSIERIDSNGNYEPSNCKWATQKEQILSKRNRRLITFDNKTQSVSEWAREYNITTNLLFGRLNMGWDLERALTQPKRGNS